ncbi:MAG TPA: 2-amino-4-hydroxy-6-hydroxymethyldihydropteridine diphosphokinase [Alphaproteobacteria bacterium]|nr:2-amino-4-hydroxy-6-hydroxymethyldihydropteridine diphosphokinase [Alphaproteobacteria bacterium]
MKIIAIGANLPGADNAPPRTACGRALERLEGVGIRVVKRSGWFSSRPVPVAAQPRFVNGVAAVETALGPAALMAALLACETGLGRRRGAANEARIIDLDIIDYDGRVEAGLGGPKLPHPRLEGRAFVLLPLAEIAPGWRHPVSGAAIVELIAALPEADRAPAAIKAMNDGGGIFGTEWNGGA